MQTGKSTVELVDHMGSDLSVVNAARVSFGKRKKVFTIRDVGLVDYLAEHNHWSPFGHASMFFIYLLNGGVKLKIKNRGLTKQKRLMKFICLNLIGNFQLLHYKTRLNLLHSNTTM